MPELKTNEKLDQLALTFAKVYAEDRGNAERVHQTRIALFTAARSLNPEIPTQDSRGSSRTDPLETLQALLNPYIAKIAQENNLPIPKGNAYFKITNQRSR